MQLGQEHMEARSLPQAWHEAGGLDTRGLVQAMGSSGEGHSRQREQQTKDVPVCISDNR